MGDENLERYRSYIKENNLKNYVKPFGFKQHNETINMINEADIAIQALLSEGLSIFIQESVFLGKAIVATNVGGTCEIVIDEFNGYIIEPKNHHQLAEKLELILSDPTKITFFGKNSLEIAKNKLSLENNMENDVKLYKRILDY